MRPASPVPVTGGRRGVQGARLACWGALGALLALSGCAGRDIGTPVDWWHDLEGGRIAQERPAPPRADAPYRNLAEVPARPVADDPAARGAIVAALSGDQRDAAYGATIAPLPAPTPRPVMEVDPDAAGATIPAASPVAKPAAVAPVAAAPVVAGKAAPAVVSMPDIPAAPPAPARLDGVKSVTVAAPPPRAPAVQAPAQAPHVARAPVVVAFAAGSAVLPPGAAAALQALARERQGDDIVIAGFGEAAGSASQAQAGSLGLGFARARAMTTVLAQAGVPSTAMRVTAEAIGRGGVARLVR